MATIQGVYLALFGRPADPSGLSFFNGVTGNGTNLAGIGDLAKTAEYLTRFTGQSNKQIIESIYQSLFGRAGEENGVNFFLGELAAGRQTVNTIAINILDGAVGTDLQTVTNKLAASNLFTNALDLPNEAAAYVGTSAADIGRNYLSTITSDPSTIPSLAQADAAVLLLFGAASSFALTIFTDNFTGTAGTDKFTAAQAEFFNAIDTIDGGGGSDSITITAVTAAPLAASPTMTNVESMTVTGTGGLNLDFGKITGLNNVIYDASGDLIASNVSSELFVFGSKTDGGTTDATFSMASGQSTLKLMLNGSNSIDADIAQLKTGTASIINIESIGPQGSILFGGDRSLVNDILYVGENANGATFNITGDASTSIAGGINSPSIVNGSGHTGDLYITGSSGGDQFVGGSGNNTYNGMNGFDIIDLSKSTGQRDEIRLWDVKTFADRDLVGSFQAGSGGDEVEIRASNTTVGTDASSSPVFGTITGPATVATTLNISSFDVIEFAYETTSGPLSTSDAGFHFLTTYSANGTHAISASTNSSGYFVAYADGNAALLYVENDAVAGLSQNEIQLVGIFSNIAVGAFDASNIDLF